MVSFLNINPADKLPGTRVEIDPSQAGTPVNPKFICLHGIKTAAGTAPVNQLIAVGTQRDADTLGGIVEVLRNQVIVLAESASA